MRRLLLVDDDPFVSRLYRDRLSAHGFQVNTVASGSAAISILRSAKPDVVVLDLMMPDLSGVEVLKFIRGEPRLAATPVVVLTNAYLNDLGRQASAIGVQKAWLKSQCSPAMLMASIDEILGAAPGISAASPPAAGPTPTVRAGETPSLVQSRPGSVPTPKRVENLSHTSAVKSPPAKPGASSAPAPPAANREEFLTQAPEICAKLRRQFQALARSAGKADEVQARLQALYREVHSLAGAAGTTELVALSQTAAVFEALTYVLMDGPERITPSVLRTLASLVDFVELLVREADASPAGAPLSTRVLVVDDDPISNRMVVSALNQAQLHPRSTEDPLVAWQWAHHEQFDVVLLDIEMPGLNGFDFCQRLRAVPGYEKVPVVFVTIHSEFENRAKSSLSGGDDLIAKPILPMELAAKVVMHLVKSQSVARKG